MRALLAIVAISLLAVATLSGCTTRQSGSVVAPYTMRPATDIIKSSYTAADSLIKQIAPSVATDAPLIVATVVNINRLEESSPLGRLIAEQVAGRLAQGGFRVIEVKLRNQVYLKRDEGDLLLTREVRDIARKHNAQAIVAGTYTDGADRVFVNLKVVQLEGNIVLGAFDYYLERDALIRSLLKL